jgi:hypothetical protein
MVTNYMSKNLRMGHGHSLEAIDLKLCREVGVNPWQDIGGSDSPQIPGGGSGGEVGGCQVMAAFKLNI